MNLIKLLKERSRRRKAREESGQEPVRPLVSLTEDEVDRIWGDGRGFKISSRPVYVTQKDDWED